MADDRDRAQREQRAELERDKTRTEPASELPLLTAGTIVGGQYEIVGAGFPGGMGVVYPALDRQLEERVALKLMHPHFVGSESLVRQFKDEARNGLRLRHEGVVAVRHALETPLTLRAARAYAVAATGPRILETDLRKQLDPQQSLEIAARIFGTLNLGFGVPPSSSLSPKDTSGRRHRRCDAGILDSTGCLLLPPAPTGDAGFEQLQQECIPVSFSSNSRT